MTQISRQRGLQTLREEETLIVTEILSQSQRHQLPNVTHVQHKVGKDAILILLLLQGRLSVLTLISVSVPPPCYRSST